MDETQLRCSNMAVETVFEKVVGEGRALAHVDGKALFVLGALPGERATVEVTRSKATWMEGTLESLLEASPHRHKPLEAHYMSCSPWQSIDYDYQLELKTAMLAEMFGRPELSRKVAVMIGSPKALGYRNKLEFTVETDAYGELALSFHERGSYAKLMAAADGCVLGSEAMNKVATGLLARMQSLDLADFADTLTVRESESTGEIIAILQVKKQLKRDWQSLMIGGKLVGMGVVMKEKHNEYRQIWSVGKLELDETIGGVATTYPWDSFFQVNLPVFEQALAMIIAAVPEGSRVFDLYSGAGTIGLAVARRALAVVGIETIASSVALANANAVRNGIDNYRAIASTIEAMDPSVLHEADVVIVDPPRAGLHPRVVNFLTSYRPATIIYLSCNPATQVRDLLLLQDGGYKVGEPTGFDFYPGTLHLESLVILRKTDETTAE